MKKIKIRKVEYFWRYHTWFFNPPPANLITNQDFTVILFVTVNPLYVALTVYVPGFKSTFK